MPIECHRDVLRGGLTAFTNAIAWPKRTVTPRVVGDIAGTALGTLGISSSSVYYIPFVVPREVVISGMRVSVTTSASGSVMLGIYSSMISGGIESPYVVLAQLTSALDMSTTGDKTGSFSSNLKLLPGVVYWAALASGTTATLRALQVASIQSSFGRVVNSSGNIHCLIGSAAGAVLPNPAPGSLTESANPVPAIYLIEV